MGQTQQKLLGVSTTEHVISLPVHFTCRSHPQYNESTNIRIIYGKNTHLNDILTQIDRYIALNLRKKSTLHFDISAISDKSFIDKTIVFDDENISLSTSDLRFESITNYKQKYITAKGVHIILKISDSCTTFYNKLYANKNTISSIRKPLQQLSSQNIEQVRKKKNANFLDERLKKLCDTSDVAYENFDDIMYHFRNKEDLLFLSIDRNYIENIQKSLTWQMRTVLIDWLYDLQRDLKLNNETIFASINYIDLYLSKCIISRVHLQLLGVTSIMIASLTYEIMPQPMKEWIFLSDDQYSTRQIINLKKKLLELIDWNIFQVTPYNYIEPWLEILEINPYSNEKFIIDLLIQSVSLNKMYLEIKLSKLVASIFYLAKIYVCDLSEYSLNLLSTVSKFDIVGSKSINEDIIVQLNQIITSLIQKGDKDSMSSSIYKKFTNKKYISKIYGKNNDIIDINVYTFNSIFNEYKKKM